MNKKLLLIITTILLLTLSACTNGESENYIENGNQALEEYNYSQALLEYKKAVNDNPLDNEAYIKVSDVYELKGDFQNAINTLKEAEQWIVDDSELLPVMENLARINLDLKNFTESLEYSEKALNINSNSQPALITKMVTYSRLDNTDQLEQIANQRVDVLDSYELEILKGLSFLNNPEKALGFLNKAEELLVEEDTLFSEMKKEVEDLNKEDSITNNIEVIRTVINFGKPSFVSSKIDNIIETNKFFEGGYLYKGISQVLFEEYQKAEENLNTAIKYNPNIYESYLYLAISQHHLNKDDLAKSNFQKSLTFDNANKYAIYTRYLDYARDIQDLETQAKILQQLQSIDEEKEWESELIKVKCLQKDIDYLKGLELENSIIDACINFINEDYSTSLDIIEKYLQNNPSDVFGYYLRYEVYTSQEGELDKKDDYYYKVIDIDLEGYYSNLIIEEV